MSANNQVIVLKKKKNFEVHENLCVDNEFEPTKESLLKKFKELKLAIRYANEYCNEYPYVEYGVHISEECLV